jgi:hypothetical protein
MKGIIIWSWLLGIVFNATVIIDLARIVGLPLLVAVIFLVVLEGVPILWMTGLIPKTRYINSSLVGGIWVVMQLVAFAFFIVNIDKLPIIASDWGIAMSLILIPLCGIFMYFRTKLMVLLINKYRK